MKTIIAGPRTIFDYATVVAAVHASGFTITEVVSGKALGVDILGERYAILHDIPIKPFPAKWKKYGKYEAGFIRNEEMAQYADALIAVWDGQSSGTKHMIYTARFKNLKVFVFNCELIKLSEGQSV